MSTTCQTQGSTRLETEVRRITEKQKREQAAAKAQRILNRSTEADFEELSETLRQLDVDVEKAFEDAIDELEP